MQCQCGYTLWGTRDGRCPECGCEFDVSDWQFNRGEVIFLCSHCHAALPHDEPGDSPSGCPQCKNTIQWQKVAVKPKLAHAEPTAIKRQKAWQGLHPAWPAFFGVIPVAIAWLVMIEEQPIVKLLVMLLLIGLWSLVVAKLSQPTFKRSGIVVAMVIVLIGSSGSLWEYTFQHRRWVDKVFAVRGWTHLRAFWNGMQAYHAETGSMPDHPVRLLGWYFHSGESFMIFHSSHDPLTTTIGTGTLHDWLDRPGNPSDIELHATSTPAAETWVQIGDFIIDRTHAVWTGDISTNTPLAITYIKHPQGVPVLLVLYNDGGIDLERNIVQWRQSQNRLRKELGLPPLPPDQ